VAQRVDGLVETAGLPERLDLGVDLAQLLLESGQLLGARARQQVGARRRRNGSILESRRGVAVERTLAVRDLEQGLVERGRGIGGDHRPRKLAIQIGDRAIDRAHALLDLDLGGAAFGDQLVEPLVELGNDVDQLRRGRLVPRFHPGHLRVRRTLFRELTELPSQTVEAIIDPGEALVDRGAVTILDRRQAEPLGQLGRAALRSTARAVRGLAHVAPERGAVILLARGRPARLAIRRLSAAAEAAWVGEKCGAARTGMIRIPIAEIVVIGSLIGTVVLDGGCSMLRPQVPVAIRAGVISQIVLRLREVSRVDARMQRRVEDRVIEPLTDRYARAARRFARGIARPPPDPRYLPRITRLHARIRLMGWDKRGRADLVEPALVNKRWTAAQSDRLGSQFLPFEVNRPLRSRPGRRDGTRRDPFATSGRTPVAALIAASAARRSPSPG